MKFPRGETGLVIPMPTGYRQTTTDVTVGSTQNDMAQALVADGCEAAGVQYRIVHADDADDGDEYATEAIKEVLMLGAPADQIYEGMYY